MLKRRWKIGLGTLKNCSPWLQQYGFPPTQKNIGSDPYPIQLNQSILYDDRMISMIPLGLRRPSAAEYPPNR
jgi:hypothetical protein